MDTKAKRIMMRETGAEESAALRLARYRRDLARGVTLVEVLIVVAIMAVIAGGATMLVFPEYKKARIKAAVIGASTIKQAAQTYIEIDMVGGADTCPTMQDLVAGRKIDRQKTDDPWGVPYVINCADGEIHVISAGNDRKIGTPDDVRDDMKPAEVEKLAALGH
jgi:general secretion pathway protein G